MTSPSELRTYQEDPDFDFDGDLEGGTYVPVVQDQTTSSVSRIPSGTPRASLTPVGMTVREERRLFRSAAGSATDQRLSAGEREVIPEYGTPTEYPVAYPGSGNPAQYSDMPGFSTGQIPVH